MKRIIKKIGKYLLYTLLVVSSYIIAGECFTNSVLSDSFTRGWLFNWLGLLSLVPYYYLIFRLVGFIKTDKDYKAKIKHLEDELFNLNYEHEATLRELEHDKDLIYNELFEVKQELMGVCIKEEIWERRLKEAQEETIEAKAKYVELVNSSYRGNK